MDKFYISSKRVAGLYILDKIKDVDLFKKTVSLPIIYSPFPAE